MTEVQIECPACRGTGLYSGFAEPKGTAVVCHGCNGTGCVMFAYVPFVKRKGRRGIKTVRLSRGTFIGTGIGPVGGSITYKQFQDGQIPSGM